MHDGRPNASPVSRVLLSLGRNRFRDSWMCGGLSMLIKLKLYVQMDIYKGKMIKIFFARIASIITGEQS